MKRYCSNARATGWRIIGRHKTFTPNRLRLIYHRHSYMNWKRAKRA